MIHHWSTEEIEWVRSNLHLTKRQLAEALSERFGFACTSSMVQGVFKRYRILSGRTGFFQNGQVPFNKGLRGVNGVSSTQFKGGNRPHNTVAVGTERIVKGDFVEVKVADPGEWKGKHIMIWERENGRRVPAGHAVIFADRDKRNFDPANMILVSRAELAVMIRLGLVSRCAEATAVGVVLSRVVLAGGKKRRAKR